MVRRTAQLSVTVEDKPLSDHLEKVRAAVEAWGNLKGYVSALAGTDVAKVQGVFRGMSDALGEMKGLKGDLLGKLGDTFAKIGAAGTSFGTVAPHLRSMADSITQMAEPTRAWAEHMQAAARASSRMSRAIERFAEKTQESNVGTAKMATTAEQATGKIQEQKAAVDKLTQSLDKQTRVSMGATKEKKSALGVMDHAWQRFYIRWSTHFFILGQQARHIFAEFAEAAQFSDLQSVMIKSTSNWTQIMEDTKRATKGMISDFQILKSAALMSSFKIPIQDLAQNMALISKLAIRTGQDQNYLFDSFARGVARLSPAILDNLGLQIKLEDAYTTFAAVKGTTLNQMDAQAKKQAVLNEVIRQASELTKDIDPSASLAAKFAQSEALWSNLWKDITSGMAQGVVALGSNVDYWTAVLSDRLAIYNKQVKEGAKTTEKLRDIWVAIDPMTQKSFGHLGGIFSNVMGKERAGALLRDMGVLKDLTKLTSAELEKEAERVKQVARQQALYLPLLERIAKAKRSVGDAATATALLPQDEGRTAYFTKTLADAVSLEMVVKSLESGYTAMNDVQARASKFTSEDMLVQNAYKAIIQERLANHQRIVDVLREQANEGNRFARLMLQNMDLSVLLLGVEDDSLKKAKEKSAEYRIQNAALIQQVANIEAEVRNATAGLEGRSQLAQRHLDLEAELGKQRTEYLEMLQKSAVRNVGEGDVTNEQLVSQKNKLLTLIAQVKATKERVRLEEFGRKFLEDTTFWTKEMKKDEFERLAAGKSLTEVKARLAGIQRMLRVETEIQAEAEERLARASANVTKENAAQLLMGIVDRVQWEARMTMMRQEAERLSKALTLFPKGGAGTGPAAQKNKEMIEKTIDSDLQILEHGMAFKFTEIEETWAAGMYGVMKRISSVAGEATEFLVFGPQERIIGQLEKDLGGFWVGAIKDLENNTEKLQVLAEIRDKFWATMDAEEQNSLIGLEANLRNANVELLNHIELWALATQGMTDYGNATQWAFQHADKMLGEDVIKSMRDLGNNVDALGSSIDKALKGEAGGYEVLGAGLNMVRSFTNDYIKDLRKRAAVEMLMNAAMAWAAWPNPGKVLSHSTAAVMFGLVAGGAVRLPGQSRGDDRDQAKRSAAPLHLHIYSEMAMTDSERGALIDRAMSQAAAEGRI